MIKRCIKCGKEFENKTKRMICSDCHELSAKSCPICGKKFYPKLVHGKEQECCSIVCANKYKPKKDGYICSWAKEKTKEKIKQTNLEKYGSESHLSAGTEVRRRIEETNLERYGGISPMASESVKEKLKEALLHRTEEQKEETKEKIKQTFLEHFGVSHPFQDPEVVKKAVQTKKDRYGEHLEVLSERVRQNNLKRLGVFKPEQFHLPDELKKLIVDREASVQFLEKGWNMQELFNYFGGHKQAIISWIRRFNLKDYIKFCRSGIEDEVRSYFPGWINTRQVLIKDGKYQEIDIYSAEKKLGIEINGNYWHSDLNVKKEYHLEKSLLAESLGVRLIHIYEWEWRDERIRPILLSLFSLIKGEIPNRIYARQCEIRKISNNEAKSFSEKNHLQGHRNAKITYGLFYQNQLVQLMSFSKHPKYEWEIIRGCPGSNNLVVGGVSKLFTHFVREYNPSTVFSYCDYNKFDGRSYEELGMKFIGLTGPDKVWLVNGKAVRRNPHRYRELRDSSEAIIWGAGSKKYLWKKGGDANE